MVNNLKTYFKEEEKTVTVLVCSVKLLVTSTVQ